ncbi:MAG: universal stress protein [Nitrospira sp.]
MKIIAAYDGSKYGRWAIEWVEHLPLKAPSRLTVVHVVDPQWVPPPRVVQPAVVGNQRFERAEIQRLEKLTERLLAKAQKLSVVVSLGGKVIKERGAIPKMILEHAPKRNGMVILGSRGLSALDRFMLGSVSTRVAQYAPCPVLVVKQPPRTIRRILLAMDRSKSSRNGLNFLITRMVPNILPGRNDTRPIEVVVAYALPFDYSRGNRAVRHVDKAPHVDEGARRLRQAGFSVIERVEMGDPASTILKIAAKQKPDLIVTGSKGIGAVERLFVGSVSYQILQQAHCSVLIIK